MPTLYTSESIAAEPDGARNPRRARSKEITAVKDRSFQLVLKAGLPIGFATDAAVVPHGENAREFGYRVRLGQSPMRRHRVGDEDGRRNHRLERPRRHDRGRQVRRSHRRRRRSARDITELERVKWVMKGGVVYKDVGQKLKSQI